mmetsp:Transcript_6950/g.20139  ORF Transcript_6950/g.20139 Transcript_6950/m.20139 type:complete len:246 (-) Transcript_6950:68-805(-)
MTVHGSGRICELVQNRHGNGPGIVRNVPGHRWKNERSFVAVDVDVDVAVASPGVNGANHQRGPYHTAQRGRKDGDSPSPWFVIAVAALVLLRQQGRGEPSKGVVGLMVPPSGQRGIERVRGRWLRWFFVALGRVFVLRFEIPPNGLVEAFAVADYVQLDVATATRHGSCLSEPKGREKSVLILVWFGLFFRIGKRRLPKVLMTQCLSPKFQYMQFLSLSESIASMGSKISSESIQVFTKMLTLTA